MGYVERMSSFIEAGVFDGRSDDGSTGVGSDGARDYIDVGCADDEVQWRRGRQGDGEHLPFSGNDREIGERRGGGGPGSGALDELSGVEGCVASADLDGAAGGSDGEDLSVGAKVDWGCEDSGEEDGGELARIEALFFQEDEGMVAGDEGWEKLGECCGGEDVFCGVGG